MSPSDPSGARAPTEVEEAAAVAAVLVVLEQRRAAAATEGADVPGRLDAWIAASRRSSRHAGMTRGPWRLSERVRRRSRA